MAFRVWKPGMIMTEERMNDAAMIGAVVFHANRSTNQSIASGADTAAGAIQWDEVTLDLLGGWSAGQPTRWTAPRAGWWMLAGAIGLNGSTGGDSRDACWYINGALAAMGRARSFANTGIVNTALTVEARTLPRLMEAGDYVELIAAQNSGAALNTATGSLRPYIAISYAGPA